MANKICMYVLTGHLSLAIWLQPTGTDEQSYVQWVMSCLGQATAMMVSLKA